MNKIELKLLIKLLDSKNRVCIINLKEDNDFYTLDKKDLSNQLN